MATLIVTTKLSDVDRQAWLADVLARIAGIPACTENLSSGVVVVKSAKDGV
jgi:hypothetical protein